MDTANIRRYRRGRHAIDLYFAKTGPENMENDSFGMAMAKPSQNILETPGKVAMVFPDDVQNKVAMTFEYDTQNKVAMAFPDDA